MSDQAPCSAPWHLTPRRSLPRHPLALRCPIALTTVISIAFTMCIGAAFLVAGCVQGEGDTATPVAVSASSTIAAPPARIKVLFVGNSLTFFNDLPLVLEAMIDAADAGPARIVTHAYPNFGLQDHWTMGDSRASIAKGGWDVVVLQQGPSATEGRPSLLEYTKRFDEEITAHGGRTALYGVWPSQQRDFDFDGVCESYRMAAESVDGLLFPAGEAWRAAWRRDATLQLYGRDKFHPSPAGSYLAAAVMFQQLTGKSPVGLPARLNLRGSKRRIRLSRDVAKLLQEAAAEANAQFARVPADPEPDTDETPIDKPPD